MNIPANLKYTKDDEWIRLEGNVAYIGITDYAQKELGDIIFVDVDTVDETLEAGENFGTIEVSKTVAELLMPVSGTIVELNEEITDAYQLINEDPYGKGWIVKAEVSNPSELDSLMDAEAYKTYRNL